MQGRRGLYAALLVAAVFAVYARSVFAEFVWDDEHFVRSNLTLASWHTLPRIFLESTTSGAGLKSDFYRPSQSITHFFDLHLWGADPRGHHLTNVLLQAATTLAVFFWLSTLAPLEGALAAAALWALHPLQVEAVAYISGRGDILAVFFLCAGLALSGRSLILTFCCAVLGLLSKESLVTFPALLFLHDRALSRPLRWPRYVPFAALLIVYVTLRLTLLNFHDLLNFNGFQSVLTEHKISRLFTYLPTLPEGLRLWLWPSDLHHDRAWQIYASLATPRVWLSALFVAAWLGAAAFFWKRNRTVSVGLLWFIVATAPTSNLVILVNSLFFDHWFLLPGLGLALVLAQVPILTSRTRPYAIGATLLLCAACGTVSQKLIDTWHDPVAFNTYLRTYEPHNTRVLANLAGALAERGGLGDSEESISIWREAIATEDHPGFHAGLARVLESQGDLSGADTEYRSAVQMDPRYHEGWIALAMFESKNGNHEGARQAAERDLLLFPKRAEAYLVLAQMALEQGDTARALAQLQHGIEQVEDPRLRAGLEKVRARLK